MLHETIQHQQPIPEVDEHLYCLQVIAHHYGLSTSATLLTAGLPLVNGCLTRESLHKAAGRIGLEMSAAERSSLRRIPEIDLPAILLRPDERPFVLLKADQRACLMFLPEEGQERYVSHQEARQLYGGRWIALRPFFSAEDDAPVEPLQGGWFWSVARLYSRSYTTVIAAAVVINIIALLSPLFVMNVYDRILPNKATTTLWVFVAGIGLALLFDFLLKLARARVVDRIGRKIDVQVSSNLLEKVLATRLSARSSTTGLLASRMQEYEIIREFLSSSTLMLLVDMAFFALFSLVIYLIVGWLVIIPLAALAIVIAIGIYLQARLAEVVRKTQVEAALRHSVLVESISSLETIKSIRAEGYILGRWEKFAGAAAESAEQAKQLTALSLHSTGFVQQCVSALVIVAGSYQFFEGEASTGAIIAAVMLSSRVVAPLTQVSMMFSRFHYVRMAFAHFNQLMEKPDETVSSPSFVNREMEKGAIDIRNVTFTYPGSTSPVLNSLSLSIRPGERIGIIGRIGSGKTTLGRLVTGLYEPDQGEILIDGIDIRQYHPREIRSGIALVAQDADLFYGSVRENLIMANPRATDHEIARAAQLAGLDEFVGRSAEGFEMQVGERGCRLSGGQRQCLALARAFLTNPMVVILDEPSSAMDLQAERQFIERLRSALSPQATLIIATHRQSMLQLVDRLIVIGQGKILKDGPCAAILDGLRQGQMPPS